MKPTTSKAMKAVVVAGVLTLGLSASDRISFNGQAGWMSRAEAIIGRPLTPMSYAGVARRTTRRAVAVGAAAGAAVAVAPVVVAPTCVQAVDAYGRLYWRCP